MRPDADHESRRAPARAARAGWHSPSMHARSALFDVYGDHLRSRGDQAPVSALIRLLEPVGIAAPAVRTAISRMVDAGLAGAGPARRRPRLPGHPAGRSTGSTEAADADLPPRPAAWDGTLAPRLRRAARRARRAATGCAPT